MTKEEARIFQKKRILEIEDRNSKEDLIRRKLINRLAGYKKVIFYRADKWEVDLDLVWKSPKLVGIDFYFPRVISKSERKMEFVKPTEWRTGSYGIQEPIGEYLLSPEDADVSIIPALGFHKKGFRLGRGAGFYDGAYASVNPKKMIGIGFSELFSIDFPYSDYDIRVGELITDTDVLFF
jgi:5-formyltetrahydrofolate cyclo-ligase